MPIGRDKKLLQKETAHVAQKTDEGQHRDQYRPKFIVWRNSFVRYGHIIVSGLT